MEKATMLESPKQDSLDKIKKELKSVVLNQGVVWGEGLDENNKPYNWVMDTKAFLLDPRSLHITAQLFMDKIEKYRPDAIGGLTLASHLIASALVYLSFDTECKFDGFLVRRERKQYSMMKLIEGVCKEKSNVVIVDDGLNAAGFATRAIEAVESHGCKVLAVIVLTDFEREEHYQLREKGYIVESIFTLKELGLEPKTKQQTPDLYELKWRYGMVNSGEIDIPKSSPIVENDKIYVGSDQGRVLCLNLSGELLWEFKSDPHFEGIHATPIIVKDKIIIGGYDGGIYAINKNDGSLVWKNKVSSWIGSTATYDEETKLAFVGLENSTLQGTLAAINAENGNIVWEFTTNNHVPCRPAVWQDLVVFGSNDFYFYALDKKTGKLIWKYRTYGEIKGRISIDNNMCFFACTDGRVYCIELKTGNLIWKRKIGRFLLNQPVIYGDKVVVGSYSNQLTALDKKTGKVLWYFMTNGPIVSYPTYHEGMVYFGSRDNSIYVVDAENGALQWKFITGGMVTSSPAVYKNKLLVSSNDGYLYCFEKKSNDSK
mgnify:CR=1 FL=1